MFSVVLNPPVSGRILNTSTPAVGHFQPAAEALLQNLPPILPASILPQFPGVVKGEKRYFRPPPPPDKTRNLYKEKQKGRQKFRLPVLADIRRCADIPFINSCFHTPAARFRRPLRSVKEKRRCTPEGPDRALPCPFCRP